MNSEAVRSSVIFDTLLNVLDRQLPQQLAAVPTRNSFAHQQSDLRHQLTAFCADVDSTRSLLVISDGVVKRSGCGELSIDALVSSLLNESRVSFEHISLDTLLSCQPSDVHASMDAVRILANSLRHRETLPAAVLVLGSGSITDIVKHTLHSLSWSDVKFWVLPTALTVTAFTSHFAVLEEAGAKRTQLSRRVDVCLWFAPVLSSAPIEMTRAGYGDLLARFVAYGDWYLGWRFGVADRYDELAYRLMEPFSQQLRASATHVATWPVTHTAIEDLSAILAMAGIAMSVSGETTPLSGYEHTISHALDFLRLTSGRPLCWHGEQVALASLTSAESFQQLLSCDVLDLSRVQVQSVERIKRTIRQMLLQAPYFGAAEGILSEADRKNKLAALEQSISTATEIFTTDYLKKHQKWLSAQEKVKEVERLWPEIREHLGALVIDAQDMRALLRSAGLPEIPEELSQPTTALEYRWAVRFAPFVRSRPSLADIMFWLGEDPAVWALI